ncbi:DUF1992 domain-containing protein [Arthrobacter sp. PAMC25284]|uniref:DnaJ family domain-containing protein n=1 Tax=Arthrobacter sp. PAMC25284 TaxID=2861279 RepID=UPI001C633E80|nr:DUF1992 domain-containing protein [Arthrobacter sp. PAMC25284]QYF89228.1 DUF1992 domain-containing protein [Arthrobacter sp. PAMC25284]
MAEETGNGGTSAFRRRVERAARFRAARTPGATAEEDAELAAADDEVRQRRAKVDDEARAEYLVRDAMAQGKFDNLKYAGKPIPGLGEGYDPDWWVRGLIQRENLTGMGPKAILLRTEDAGLDVRLDGQHSEKQVRDILADFNTRVIDARRQLQGGPPVVTKIRDLDAEVEHWRARKAAAAAAAASAVPVPEQAQPKMRRRWWRRLRDGAG